MNLFAELRVLNTMIPMLSFKAVTIPSLYVRLNLLPSGITQLFLLSDQTTLYFVNFPP